MNVWVVLKGASELTMLQALLPRNVPADVRIVPTGDRSNMTSVARTLLVKHREPLAIMLDTDSMDPTVIREKYQTTEHLLQAVAGAAHFKILLCIPVWEAVFFYEPEILARIFPQFDWDGYRMFYMTQPREALKVLFAQGGGPKTITEFLSALTETDLQQLRMKPPISELILFLNEVIRGVPAGSGAS